jgi:hypothetical protein
VGFTLLYSFMNTTSLTGEIKINRANDDAFMMRRLFMQSDEMFAIEGYYSTVGFFSKVQHRIIRKTLIRQPGLLYR